MARRWTGKPPACCDLCKAPIANDFVDGRTIGGPWANMCLDCHAVNGAGLGLGKGQHYRLTKGERHDGRDAYWAKVAG